MRLPKRTLIGALAAVAIATFGAGASAQQNNDTSGTGNRGAQSSGQYRGTQGSQRSTTAQRGTSQRRSGNVQMTEQQLTQKKAALRAHVRRQLDNAGAKIDALQKLDDKASGATKQRYDTLLTQVKDRRDTLSRDLGDIEGATVNDWRTVSQRANRDLAQLRQSIQRVAYATRASTPRSNTANANQRGTTNRQGTNHGSVDSGQKRDAGQQSR